MRLQCMNVWVIVCLGIAMSGCQRASDSAQTQAEPAHPAGERDLHVATPSDSGTAQAPTVPEGWKVYTPPEGDFSVVVPGEPTESSSNKVKIWKLRRYTFEKGGTPMVVELYSERTGKIATNTVEELRSDPGPDIVPGTLRDVLLPGMAGVEFRTKGRIGNVVHREFCSPDKSRSITLFVQKDLGGGLSEAEVRVFLDSFKLLH